MCCLFGIIDNNLNLPAKNRKSIAYHLSVAAMDRGIDATGFAYVANNGIVVKKAAKAANNFNCHIAKKAPVIMGHTRLTTQGDGNKNFNNHPFIGNAEKQFAFAHNGVLWNDKELRRKLGLPKTRIETDSYICVQIMEQLRSLSLDSVRAMCELTEGNYCYTFLDEDNNFTFVKGNNPLTIYYFPRYDVYIYASTKTILDKGLSMTNIDLGEYQIVDMAPYSILRINHNGEKETNKISVPIDFNYGFGAFYYETYDDTFENNSAFESDDLYYGLLVVLAERKGYTEKDLIYWQEEGFSLEDIEMFLYDNLYNNYDNLYCYEL